MMDWEAKRDPQTHATPFFQKQTNNLTHYLENSVGFSVTEAALLSDVKGLVT